MSKEAIVTTQGPKSGHFFRKGQKVILVKVNEDFFVFMDETGMHQALEEEDFVFV